MNKIESRHQSQSSAIRGQIIAKIEVLTDADKFRPSTGVKWKRNGRSLFL